MSECRVSTLAWRRRHGQWYLGISYCHKSLVGFPWRCECRRLPETVTASQARNLERWMVRGRRGMPIRVSPTGLDWAGLVWLEMLTGF